MLRVLILTNDLPFFPGRNGHDYFNLRHLAATHEVAVVAPLYDWIPRQGVANLEQFLSKAFFWPRAVDATPLFISDEAAGWLPTWICRLPSWARRRWLKRMLGIHRAPSDAYEKLSILSNCAPYLLDAVESHPWDVLCLIQSNLEPWLNYLPRGGAKVVYFHDIRSDYLKKARPLPGQPKRGWQDLRAIFRQERAVARRVDALGFVSDLDRQRALAQLHPRAEIGVAPIPVDTEYFCPPPPGWKKPPEFHVLFTGHLSHPPNVDAVLYFLREIWPDIKRQVPAARFQAAGMLPAPVLVEAMNAAQDCDLHPNVPDVRPFFWNARAYVVPMRFGGGVRQKLFEALAMCVPVVCTTMAAEGTGLDKGPYCWFEDSPARFSKRVAGLLVDGWSQAAVGLGRMKVEADHSIAAAAPGFQDLVDGAATRRKKQPFRLLFDLRWMELGKAGGAEQANYELVSALGGFDRRNHYRVYAPRSTCLEWLFPRDFNMRMFFSDPPERQLEAQRALLTNRLSDSLGMHKVLTPPMRSLAAYRRMDFDLVHSVCSYTHPDLLGFPGILTINDLQHLHHPQFFSDHAFKEREALYRESARRARHIVCISEFTRQDVHRQYGIPLEKLSTIWIIPSRTSWQALDADKARGIVEGLGIHSPYLFYPAQCWEHKNHARLVQAFDLIAGDLPGDMKLVFVGRPFPEDHPARVAIRDRGLSDRVVHLGYRSPLEVKALFQSCLLLAFPSLFEGFGMPVAEAIIAGKPVACSNVTSMPEIAGDAALTFDPTDVSDIAGSLLRLVKDPDLRSALVRNAGERKKAFSARRSVVETIAVYQRVYDEL